jgi:spore coat protein CotF
MNDDFLDVDNAVDMPDQADSALALDFLLTIKNAIRNYAIAITETTTSEVRAVLVKQMEQAMDLHEEVSTFMVRRDWLNPVDVQKQFAVDLKAADTAVKIANMKLFQEDTSRLGLFATPND